MCPSASPPAAARPATYPGQLVEAAQLVQLPLRVGGGAAARPRLGRRGRAPGQPPAASGRWRPCHSGAVLLLSEQPHRSSTLLGPNGADEAGGAWCREGRDHSSLASSSTQ